MHRYWYRVCSTINFVAPFPDGFDEIHGKLVGKAFDMLSFWEICDKNVLLRLPFLSRILGIHCLFRMHDTIVQISSLNLWEAGFIAVSFLPTSGRHAEIF